MEKGSYWWYITIQGPCGSEELMNSLSEASGCLGSEETHLGDVTCLQVYYRNDHPLGHWLDLMNQLIRDWPQLAVRDMGKVENRPWHTEWMEAFPPLNVGEKLVVMAPWHLDGYEPTNRIPLLIYPGSAFGTGYHESTQAVLTLLEKVIQPGNRVADIGCGSAILSVAALKLGAKSARARDLDPAVLDEAQRNLMELNHIPQQQLTVEQGDLLKGFDETVDLLMANILYEPLCAMVDDVARCVKKGGYAIFSGMVAAEAEKFVRRLPDAGLQLLDRVQLGDWVGLLTQVKS